MGIGYQNLGNGLYQVNGAVHRSALTGRFQGSSKREASGRFIVRNPHAEVDGHVARIMDLRVP